MKTIKEYPITNWHLFKKYPGRTCLNLLIAIIVLVWILVFSACEASFLYLTRHRWTEERRGLHCGYATRRLGSQIMRLLGARVRYHGLKNLLPSKCYVVVANHTSLLDTVVMLRTPKMRFVSKREVLKTPIGWMGRWGGQIFIDRQKGTALGVIRSALDRWNTCNIIFFGEGTRSRDGVVAKLQMGAAVIAREFNRSVVPVYIHGTREVLPKGPLLGLRRGGTITVTFGQSIPPCRTREEVPVFSEQVRAAIIAIQQAA